MTLTEAQVRETVAAAAKRLAELGVKATYKTKRDIYGYGMGHELHMSILIPVKPQGSVTMRLTLFFRTPPKDGENIEEALMLLHDYSGQLGIEAPAHRIYLVGNTYTLTSREPLVNYNFRWNKAERRFEYFGSMYSLPRVIYDLALMASDENWKPKVLMKL